MRPISDEVRILATVTRLPVLRGDPSEVSACAGSGEKTRAIGREVWIVDAILRARCVGDDPREAARDAEYLAADRKVV